MIGWKDAVGILAFCIAFVFVGACFIALAGKYGAVAGLGAIVAVTGAFAISLNAFINHKVFG